MEELLINELNRLQDLLKWMEENPERVLKQAYWQERYEEALNNFEVYSKMASRYIGSKFTARLVKSDDRQRKK